MRGPWNNNQNAWTGKEQQLKHLQRKHKNEEEGKKNYQIMSEQNNNPLLFFSM